MKILKRGIIPEEVPKTIKCSNCNSELEYTNKDFIKDKEDVYDRDGGYKQQIEKLVCPVCNRVLIKNKIFK